VSSETIQLLEAAENLPDDQLQLLTDEILRRNASRRSPSLCDSESKLLKEISQPLPPTRVSRYRELEGKRNAETLTAEEHRELCDLSDWLEQCNAERIDRVGKLAQMRGVTLRAMMDQLGLKQLLD